MRDSRAVEPLTVAASGAASALARRFAEVRAATSALVANLAPEDSVVQSMPEASPAKWHLAHTTWFFEHFILAREAGYQALHAGWDFIFNSYYQSVGPMHARPRRGLLSRPTLAEVLDYRAEVDGRVRDLLGQVLDPALEALLVLGLNHEQQHQELLLTDIKHLFSLNPLEPVYRCAAPRESRAAQPLVFLPGVEGIVEIGHAGAGFAFDCETPRHRTLLQPHAIANRAVTNAEFAEFIRAGGYRTSTLWLSDGWDRVQQEGWRHPLYATPEMDMAFTLAGRQPLDPAAPVCHLSYFEADAFARWAGARLPSEAEWEALAATLPVSGHFADSGRFEPLPAGPGPGALQMFGDVWEWTASPYVAYPGYRPLPGAVGEYNGKFMCGQFVLRGGACVTPAGHLRASYRNFWAPATRWQFAGLRLAKDR